MTDQDNKTKRRTRQQPTVIAKRTTEVTYKNSEGKNTTKAVSNSSQTKRSKIKASAKDQLALVGLGQSASIPIPNKPYHNVKTSCYLERPCFNNDQDIEKTKDKISETLERWLHDDLSTAISRDYTCHLDLEDEEY
jgi:hypothetical protein